VRCRSHDLEVPPQRTGANVWHRGSPRGRHGVNGTVPTKQQPAPNEVGAGRVRSGWRDSVYVARDPVQHDGNVDPVIQGSGPATDLACAAHRDVIRTRTSLPVALYLVYGTFGRNRRQMDGPSGSEGGEACVALGITSAARQRGNCVRVQGGGPRESRCTV